MVQFLFEFRRKFINLQCRLNFDEKSSNSVCFLIQLPSACRFFVIGFRFEFRRKIVNFRVPFDAITCGVSIFSCFNCCSSFDEKSSILVCISMQLPSACQSFRGSYARIVVRARVSTRASYAPLRPLVVTASGSALRDVRERRCQLQCGVELWVLRGSIPHLRKHGERVADQKLRTP